MQLTLCLIVKNEADNLNKNLKNFEPVYDELIIVDTGSVDDTKSVARKFGAKVFDFKWIDDFSAARNFALSKATKEWIMMIDADDSIQLHDAVGLREDLRGMSQDQWGVLLPYHLRHFGAKNPSVAFLPRIWRKSLNARYTLKIHEYLDLKPEQMSRFLRKDYPITHTKADDLYRKSYDRNIAILEKAHQSDPDERRYVFFLGHDNHKSGRLEEALKYYAKYAKMKNTNSHELNRVLYFSGRIYRGQKKFDESIEMFKRAIDAQDSFVEPYINIAEIYESKGEIKKALEYYLKAMKCEKPRTHVFINEALYEDYAETKVMKLLESTNV
ncbi:glycosyltransferase [Candidatus Peregrinibacteria bacterium]|nr:glycosyltransferase [Candidatus Peregrinibacteria bacterium]